MTAIEAKTRKSERDNTLRFHHFLNGGCKAISCYDPQGNYVCTYASLSQAAKAIRCHASRIRLNIEDKRITPTTGRRAIVGGFSWEWELDVSRIANCKIVL